MNVKDKVVVKYAWYEEEEVKIEVYQESDQNELNKQELGSISTDFPWILILSKLKGRKKLSTKQQGSLLMLSFLQT